MGRPLSEMHGRKVGPETGTPGSSLSGRDSSSNRPEWWQKEHRGRERLGAGCARTSQVWGAEALGGEEGLGRSCHPQVPERAAMFVLVSRAYRSWMWAACVGGGRVGQL